MRLISFALAAALGSVLKLQLPGVRGMVSVSALFVLVGIVNLSLPEALLVGALSMLVQCTWRTAARPKLVQTAFNISVLVIAVVIVSQGVRLLAPALSGTGEFGVSWRSLTSAPTRFRSPPSLDSRKASESLRCGAVTAGRWPITRWAPPWRG